MNSTANDDLSQPGMSRDHFATRETKHMPVESRLAFDTLQAIKSEVEQETQRRVSFDAQIAEKLVGLITTIKEESTSIWPSVVGRMATEDPRIGPKSKDISKAIARFVHPPDRAGKYTVADAWVLDAKGLVARKIPVSDIARHLIQREGLTSDESHTVSTVDQIDAPAIQIIPAQSLQDYLPAVSDTELAAAQFLLRRLPAADESQQFEVIPAPSAVGRDKAVLQEMSLGFHSLIKSMPLPLDEQTRLLQLIPNLQPTTDIQDERPDA